MPFLWTFLALALLVPIQDAARKAPPAGAGDGSCSEASCHADLAERPTVHGVVAEGMCDACHEHSGEGHAFSLTAEPIGDACVSCHDDPREAGPNVHAAAAEGECTVCHDPHGSDAEGLLLAEGGELCTGCHEDPAAGEHVHAPAAGGECGLCHDPHASENTFLTREAGTDLCLGCHDGQAEELAMPAVHGIVQSAGCTACHNPHSAAAAHLLHVQGNALCTACHLESAEKREPDAEGRITILGGRTVPAAALEGSPAIQLTEGKGHPLAQHPVEAESNPRAPEEPFGCASCHAPHGAERRGLIQGGSWMRLCSQCHKK